MKLKGCNKGVPPPKTQATPGAWPIPPDALFVRPPDNAWNQYPTHYLVIPQE